MNKLKQRLQEVKSNIAAKKDPSLQKLKDFLQRRVGNLKKGAKICLLASIGLNGVACSNSSENRKEQDHSQDFTPERINDIESKYENGTRISYEEALAMLDDKVNKGELKTDTFEFQYGDVHPAKLIHYQYDENLYRDDFCAHKIIFHDGTRDLTLIGNAESVDYVSWKDGEHTESMSGNLYVEDYYFRKPSNLTIVDKAHCLKSNAGVNLRGCENGRVVIGENGESIRQLYNDNEIPFVLNKAKGKNVITSVDNNLSPSSFPYSKSVYKSDVDLTRFNSATEVESAFYEADGRKVGIDRYDEKGILKSRTRFLANGEYTASFTYDGDVISTVTWSQDGKEDISLDVKDMRHKSGAATGYAHLSPKRAAKCNKSNISTAVAQSYIDSGEKLSEDSPFYKEYIKLQKNAGKVETMQRDLNIRHL